jgi:hypothetical protein
MTIIKCFKLKCEICGKEGTAQVWFGKNGDLKFGRIRHYRRLNEAKKPVFEYHAQSKEYLTEQLKFVLPKIAQPIDQKQENLDQDVDQNLNNSSLNQGVEPRAGFGPATITLPR